MKMPRWSTHILHRDAQGFTLIEISIVLVIIGLLAGGVLVGKDLIHAAEVHQQVTQLREYQLAFNTFQGKYKCIPGDCENITSFFGDTDPNGNPIINGDGNGFIDTPLRYSFDRTVHNRWSDSVEISGVFQQLGLANFITFKPESTTTYRVGQDLPTLKLNPAATFVIAADYNFEMTANGSTCPPPDDGYLTCFKKGQNTMWMLACDVTRDAMGYWNDGCAIFTALDLYSIDNKIDDGHALSGNFFGFGGDTFFSSDNSDCLDSGDYKVINTTRECQAAFVIN